MKKMKKVMFALCFMFGGIVTLTAQDTQDTTSNEYRTETQSQYPQDPMGQQPGVMDQQQDRERIQSTELPDEVKRALEGEEYRGWLISGAFKSHGNADQSMESDTTSMEPGRQEGINAAGAENEEVFIVELKNGAETKEVWFDSNGQKLENPDDQMNYQNNEFNQNNQNDQMNNPEDQMNPPSPSDQGLPTDPTVPDPNTDPNVTDPNSTTDPTTPAPDRPGDPNATDQPDQSGQSQSIDQSHSDPSIGSPSGQPQTPGSTTDHSRANEPK